MMKGQKDKKLPDFLFFSLKSNRYLQTAWVLFLSE